MRYDFLYGVPSQWERCDMKPDVSEHKRGAFRMIAFRTRPDDRLVNIFRVGRRERVKTA